MINPPYQEALMASAKYDDFIVVPLTGGLINKTYKVTIQRNGHSYILQQINKHVFPEPEKVRENHELLWSFIDWDPVIKKMPEPFYFADPDSIFLNKEKKVFIDSDNEYWRLMEFIGGTETKTSVENIIQVKAVAQTFAQFTRQFEFLDISRLYVTIDGFHDLALRYRQFQQSLHGKNYERLLEAANIINQLKEREHYVSFYEVITQSEEFEKRVMHHDAKISNILFEEETGNVVCPIDLDTVMPGYFFSDIGDMIRSMAGSHDENSTDINDISINKEFYEAIVSSYMEVMGELFTESERKYIHYSGLLIIYMQALRFLTDYLNGDIYYPTEYSEHNFDRAKNQLTLLMRLEEYLEKQYELKLVKSS